jgi:formylglycine-generating enzyme required for sulfatase activity
MTACRVPQLVGFAIAAFWMGTAFAETRSVIDPVEAPVPPTIPAPARKEAEEPDAAVKRERRRADAAQRSRAIAETRAQAAEREAAKLRAAEESRRTEAAAREAAAKAAARQAAAAKTAAARLAKAKAAEAARKEESRQAAARDAAARKQAQRLAIARQAREAAAREAAAREVAALETAAREAAARKAAARVAAAKDTAAREAAAREAAAREAAAREVAAREAAEREAMAREAAAREVAAKEAAAREAAAREAAMREAAAREAAARVAAAREAAMREAAEKEAAAREAAAKEAAAREAAAREHAARPPAAREAHMAESRGSNGPATFKVFRDCFDCPEVVWLPRGDLFPGNPGAASGQRAALKMSYVLAVGRFKVSNAEWDACVADRGCRRRPSWTVWGRARDPVTHVSWEDAQQYAAWLSRRTSKPYRLLTGAEWEYAARAGSSIYDMYGSVSEWVENCYQYRDPRDGKGGWTLECTNQTLRGGARARSYAPVDHQHDDRIGFRVARTE